MQFVAIAVIIISFSVIGWLTALFDTGVKDNDD